MCEYRPISKLCRVVSRSLKHIAISAMLFFTLPLFANDVVEVAKQLTNPVASLISIPIQANYDAKFGLDDKGERTLVNLQPVIPFSIGENWSLISRSILPVIWQHDIFPGSGSQSGTGDLLQSLFFSPNKATNNGWIYGVGPVILMPTASDDLLGLDQWAAGPTFVALKQVGGFSYGALFNHLWSMNDNNDRIKINATFLQPFITYTTQHATTWAINTESTYDWESEQWQVPINITVSQVLKVKNFVFSIGAGLRYWTESPKNGAEGFGGRLMLVFLLPE